MKVKYQCRLRYIEDNDNRYKPKKAIYIEVKYRTEKQLFYKTLKDKLFYIDNEHKSRQRRLVSIEEYPYETAEWFDPPTFEEELVNLGQTINSEEGRQEMIKEIIEAISKVIKKEREEDTYHDAIGELRASVNKLFKGEFEI